MNYTVTLDTSASTVPPPTLTFCDTKHSPNCFCASSKPPYQYFQSSNQLIQSLTVHNISTDIIPIHYIYHSGVCFNAAGSEKFSPSVGEKEVPDRNCFPPETTVIQNGIDNPGVPPNAPINIVLFERYPAKYKYSTTTPSDVFKIDYTVPNSKITINDAISGGITTRTNYNTTLVLPNAFTVFPLPIGYDYIINASEPLTIFPFVLDITIAVQRNGNDGLSSSQMTWYIPILGIVPQASPHFIPVASDPTLIFYILRDPPGGLLYI
jgi:hypothetical protein